MVIFLIQAAITAYSNDGETIWVTMLVFAVIAAGASLWSYVKKKPAKVDVQQEDFPYHSSPFEPELQKQSLSMQQHKGLETLERQLAVTAPTVPLSDLEPAKTINPINLQSYPADKKRANLQGGMELLDLDFLLSAVSDIEHNGSTDATIHKLSFIELVRRRKLSEIDSVVLKEYAHNKGKLYTKEIQCEAIKELAARTERGSAEQSR